MPPVFRGELHSRDSIDFSLYLITDRHQARGNGLLDVVRAALAGGVRAVQLREKDLPVAELLELARAMRVLTDEFGARLIINASCDICLAAGADGVHLGVQTAPVAQVRRLHGRNLVIGYSAHGLDEACQAEKDGADFVTFGPVFETPSKIAYGEPSGLLCLEAAAARLQIPVFALGGISRANIPEVMATGAHGVAMISAVMASEDPKKEAVLLLKAIEECDAHS